MAPDLTLFLAGCCVLFLAFFVKGISSFGPGLVAMPLLGLLWHDPRLAVVLITLLNIFANGVLLPRFARAIRWRTVFNLSIGGLFGIPLGAYLLSVLPIDLLEILIGIAVIASVPAILWIRRLLPTGIERPHFAVPAGFLAGVCGGAVAIDGPPCVAYMSATVREKEATYATLTAVFFVGGIVRVIAFLAFSTLHLEDVQLSLMTLPAVGLGLICGLIAYRRLSEGGFDRVVMGILLISGGGLVIQALLP